MIFKVHVVSRSDYDAHLVKLKSIGQEGAPKGAEEAHTIAGLGKSGDVAGVQGNGGGN
jgi:cytochrome c oxidase subunit 2